MAQKYHEILNNPEVIQWAKQYLKKSGRIVWYLKYIREVPSMHPWESLKHFYAMDIPAINEYNLTTQEPSYILRLFHQYEKEYIKSLSKESSLISITAEPKLEIMPIVLPNNWFWVNLNEPSSTIEANAMGHCGNSSGKLSDHVLSLRRKVVKAGKTFWEPHLTFILQYDGVLGEMKGRQNKKPHPRYHPQILALLESKKVLKIKGGGFLPHENFSVRDLKDSVRNKFIENHSSKLPSYVRELYKNLDNLSYFLKLKPQDEAEALDILAWVKSESLLLELALTKYSPLAKPALEFITSFEYTLEAAKRAPAENISSLKANENIKDINQRFEIIEIALTRKSWKLVSDLLYFGMPKEMLVHVMDYEGYLNVEKYKIISDAAYCLKSEDFEEIYKNARTDIKKILMLNARKTLEYFQESVIFDPTESLEVKKAAAKNLTSANIIEKVLRSEVDESIKREAAHQLILEKNYRNLFKGDMTSYSSPNYSVTELAKLDTLIFNPVFKKYLSFTKRIEFYNNLSRCYPKLAPIFNDKIKNEYHTHGVPWWRYQVSKVYTGALPADLR